MVAADTRGYKVIGTRPIRPDGTDKVTGRAEYGADFRVAGMLFGSVLRSPHAHARIVKIVTAKAEQPPGVLAVMTGDYFTNSKAARDAAEAGSGILSQQGSVEAVKGWVAPFAFVGLATFIAGFGFAFANILRNIRLRGLVSLTPHWHTTTGITLSPPS